MPPDPQISSFGFLGFHILSILKQRENSSFKIEDAVSTDPPVRKEKKQKTNNNSKNSKKCSKNPNKMKEKQKKNKTQYDQ